MTTGSAFMAAKGARSLSCQGRRRRRGVASWRVVVKLLVLREFEEGVVGGAADHFVEAAAGGDHGVDAVFFFYLEVD